MKLFDLFVFSIQNLKRNKMRTVLTISGVVIGIGAIVFLVSLGFGLQELVIRKIGSMESLTTIEVQPKKVKVLMKDAVDKFSKVKGVKYVSPSYQVSTQALLNGEKTDISVYGINPEYSKIEELDVDAGDNLTGRAENELVVSRAALKVFDLKEASSAIGKKIQLFIYIKKGTKLIKPTTAAQKPFLKIIGVTKEDKSSEGYVPISLIEKLGAEGYYTIKVKAKNREVMPGIKKEIMSMGYLATSVKDTISEIDSIFRWVKVVLGGFGTIALFVASIGIFNTMTISLLERTHEIGIMKAIGATNKDIRRMFVFEAAQIGLWGGLIGLFMGWLFGMGINMLINTLASQFQGSSQQIFSTPIWFAGMSIFFSLCVSLLAGVYPAKRAGKLNPIEALRYE